MNEIEEGTQEEIQSDELNGSITVTNLRNELASLLNRYSRENVSNTPDFILRDYIWDALKAFERGVNRRDEWYGINPQHEDGTVYDATLNKVHITNHLSNIVN